MKKFTLTLSVVLRTLLSNGQAYPNTPALGLKCWLKADAGTVISTYPTVDQWNDQSGAGITGDFFPSLFDACPPDIITNAYNYNPSIKFEQGTNTWNFCNYSGMYGANLIPGNALFDPLENTIFMVKEPKFGIVELKWENNFMGLDYRFGVELSGNKQRFDFCNQGAGQVNVSNTDVINKFHIGEYLTDGSNLSLYLNGGYDSGIPNPGLAFTPPVNDLFNLSISCNSVNWQLYSEINLSELLIYNKKLTFTERREVESYLAIKYGLTIGNNQLAGPSLDYLASDGTPVWTNHNGFHNHVIGIGRDDASSLSQSISKGEGSFDGTLDMIKIANGSFAAPAAFGNDLSYIVVGSNLGSLTAPQYVNFTHTNPTTNLYGYLSRIWSIQKTGTPTQVMKTSSTAVANNLIIEFDMSLISGPNANADIRLLLDDDINFGNNSPGEVTLSPNPGYNPTGGYLYFTVPYGSVPANGFFTLGSANGVTAPLPIRVSDFNVSCDNNSNHISWKTVSESGCSSFILSKSSDGANYTPLKTFSCGSLSQDVQYQYYDTLKNQDQKNYYYRLSFQTPGLANENHFPSSVNTCNSHNSGELKVMSSYFNENKFNVVFQAPASGQYNLTLFDYTGKMVYKMKDNFQKGNNPVELNAGEISGGTYLLRIDNGSQTVNKKIPVFK